MIYILCTISDVFFATQSELFQGLNARRGAELSKKDLSDDETKETDEGVSLHTTNDTNAALKNALARDRYTISWQQGNFRKIGVVQQRFSP